ncbi:hypothetical protein GCQ56_16270 [Marinifilum sp. N1E240]|uniref:hypothetical protein n=1 Tax=Marinifilum sp. N1E240 TaxID=2608082 RepID=UPI00128DA19E|nr:hypothetical protein [Marinifilum sp. N1E240]MPQ48561.1 hypothetical protein [Marinifilum sp. N1E240]
MRQLILLVAVIALIACMAVEGSAQKLSVVKSSSVSIEEFPEYVIITSQNTKLLGGIGIMIDYKKSTYKPQLQKLENLLQDGDKLKVRNQTDLLNSMSKLGFEFVNAYNSSQVSNSLHEKDNVDDIFNTIEGGTGTYRVNMIFRKKNQFR